MTVLVPYADAAPGVPSHRCDSCGRPLRVWPTPWQLAWPRVGGGHECSPCHLAKKT